MPLATLIALALLSALTAFTPQTPGQSVLGDLRIDAVMRDLNRALDIECVHCHVENEWKDESKPAFATARNMLRMVRTLNEGPLKDLGEVQRSTRAARSSRGALASDGDARSLGATCQPARPRMAASAGPRLHGVRASAPLLP
jgi:Photosynthetic reaction centre cytochrome C subunit